MKELEVLYEKTKKNIETTYLSFESELNKDECIVIQEKLVGQEYGLDIINNLASEHQVTIVKKKIAMRSGETDCAETVENIDLEYLGMQLGRRLGHIGNLDVDAFIVKEVPFILEMNARFGGGYPFSHLAGVNLPKAIIKWLNGEQIESTLLEGRVGVVGHKEITMMSEVEATERLECKLSIDK